jgi:DNA-binding NtrC family response regulator
MQNVIERAAVLATDNLIKLENLPAIFSQNFAESAAEQTQHGSFKAECLPHVMKIEKTLIEKYLLEAHGNVSKAARSANIPRRTFYRLLDRHGLKGQR